jgi:hypothetical protein
MATSDKVMFEIYREAGYGRRYRVVYFTELNEHNKEAEINRALTGDHYYDGFIVDWRKDEAKAVINRWLDRLNQGEALAAEGLATELEQVVR